MNNRGLLVFIDPPHPEVDFFLGGVSGAKSYLSKRMDFDGHDTYISVNGDSWEFIRDGTRLTYGEIDDTRAVRIGVRDYGIGVYRRSNGSIRKIIKVTRGLV